MPDPDKPAPAAEPPAPRRAGALVRGFLHDLFDLRFQHLITVHMLPGIYGIGIALSAVFTIYVVFLNFKGSLRDGLLWALLLGPAMFLGLVTALRVVLEFLLAFFRMAWYVEHVAGQAEGIRKDLPRFGWWKTLLFGDGSGPPNPKS
jgi:hypothetical protein